MPDESPKTNITWSANENYLNQFSAYFTTAQKLFLMSRRNNGYILDLFYHVHEVYRMEEPYFDGDVTVENSQAWTLKTAHNQIQKNVEIYSRQPEGYRRNNFDRIYNQLDILFSELTKIAVQKNFFPKAQKARNLDDVKKSMRLQ
jgi:hypothetical protein